LTVDRHLRNFRWKNPADIAHYREGLVKAGVPVSEHSLAEPESKRA
jgi:adenylate cyclase